VIARADALIVISQRARSVYENAGVSSDRLKVVANSVAPVALPTNQNVASNGRWLFVGRLSPEKGLVELLRTWPEGELLDVIGDGVDMARAVAVAPNGVTFYGTVDHEQIRRRMPEYVGMVFPSVWFEAGPSQVYVEALAAGLPVLAIEGNGTSDDIRDHGLGALVGRQPGRNQIVAGLDHIRRYRTELSARCVRSHAERFSEAHWVRTIEDVYRHTGRGVRG
jgi:glycosyltransferase involved in cell wall biosynthesis